MLHKTDTNEINLNNSSGFENNNDNIIYNEVNDNNDNDYQNNNNEIKNYMTYDLNYKNNNYCKKNMKKKRIIIISPDFHFQLRMNMTKKINSIKSIVLFMTRIKYFIKSFICR